MAKYTKQKLGDICRIEKGRTGIAGAALGEYPLVVTAEERKTCGTYQFDCEAVCIPLVSSSGHGKKSLKNVHYQSGKFALGSILCAVIPNNPQEVNARYLHQYLQFYKDTLLVPLMKGVANVSLSMRDIAKVEIPLPDFDTQAALAKIFVEAQKKQKLLDAEFEKQTEYAKRLRQNILQKAIEGKLTAEWRKQNPAIKGNPKLDSSVLVNELKEQYSKKNKDDEKIDFDYALQRPKEWNSIPFDCLFSIQSGLAYDKALLSIQSNDMVSILRGGNISDNGEILEKQDDYFISREFLDKIPTLQKNMLITPAVTSYEQVGKIALVRNDNNQNVIGGFVLMYIPRFDNTILTNYTYIVLSSDWFKNICRKITRKSGQAFYNISRQKLRIIDIALPSLNEQEEIVNKVDSLLKKVIELEKKIQEHKKMTEKLVYGVIKEKLEK